MADDFGTGTGATISKKVAQLRRQEEEQRAQELAQRLNLPYTDPSRISIDGLTLSEYPKTTLAKAGVMPIAKEDHTLVVLAVNPDKPDTQSFLSSVKAQGLAPKLMIVSQSSLKELLAAYERYAKVAEHISGELTIAHEKISSFKRSIATLQDLKEKLEKFSPKDFGEAVELVLAGALFADASDLHLEPREDAALVRMRVDGILQDIAVLERPLYLLALERIKLLAGLKLNVRDRAQDGRFTIHEEGQDIEIRASSLPGKFGEFAVLRVLNPKNLLDLEALGLRKDLLAVAHTVLKKPNGMVITCGPTGSGKTTLLYAFVRKVATQQVKIITIEDPIEYRIEGMEQTQVDHEAGYTFDVGLRSIVRQDPDYILVGEIRDKETADIAMQAALTGHLVFSTLHTNDAPGAIPRLVEFGAKPEIIAPALTAVFGQRLARRLCPKCSVQTVPDDATWVRVQKALFGAPQALGKRPAHKQKLKAAKGCAQCHHTGYQGRIGLFELFLMDAAMQALALRKPSTFAVRQQAIKKGMATMQQDGLLRVLEGTTDLPELERVTGPLEDMEAFLKAGEV